MKEKQKKGARDEKEEPEEKKTDKKEEQINELTDSLQRLQAEFENFKKRTEKEKQEFVKYAKADMILKLLPFLDTFELALKNTKSNEEFVKGVEMIYAQLSSLLESQGVRPIKALGEKFDSFKHEVLMKIETDKEEDTIIEEIQKGYMLDEKVLRHSKVKVSKKSEGKRDPECNCEPKENK